MFLRSQRGDAEGLFRRHWLLIDSLEIFCDTAGRLYEGPKKSLLWMERERPEAYALYEEALRSPEDGALERWVAYLESLA